MAKAKILDNKVVITSEILTDENIKRASILAPSVLQLVDEFNTSNVLFEVTLGTFNVFTCYGAVFKDGKTLGTISEEIMEQPKEEREADIKSIITASLTKINAVEKQVEEYLADAEDLSTDIEFMD